MFDHLTPPKHAFPTLFLEVHSQFVSLFVRLALAFQIPAVPQIFEPGIYKYVDSPDPGLFWGVKIVLRAWLQNYYSFPFSRAQMHTFL